MQISLSDARADNDPDAEIGEEHTKEIIFANFGRRAILNLRQTLQSKILDLQKETFFLVYLLQTTKNLGTHSGSAKCFADSQIV